MVRKIKRVLDEVGADLAALRDGQSDFREPYGTALARITSNLILLVDALGGEVPDEDVTPIPAPQVAPPPLDRTGVSGGTFQEPNDPADTGPGRPDGKGAPKPGAEKV